VSRLASATLLPALLVAAALPASAGIVIKKNGNVFVGTIEEGDVTTRTITLRAPRLSPSSPARAESKMSFDQSEVRWFDVAANEPTDAYFDRFLGEPLDLHWQKFADDYVERKKHPPLIVDNTPPTEHLVPIAFSRRFKRCEVSIRRPRGWKVAEGEGIAVFEAPTGHARIHMFASDLSGPRALEIARQALERLGARFDYTTKPNEWLTKLHCYGRTLHAVRRIVQTDRSTAFAIAYAGDDEYDRIASLLSESLDTFQVHED